MRQATRRSAGTVLGLAGASSRVLVHSINYGLAGRSGRYVEPRYGVYEAAHEQVLITL